MPTLANIFGQLEAKRAPEAARRDQLLSAATVFESELSRITRPWLTQSDPITGRPWLTIEDEIGDVAWGKRLRLFNRHFVKFVITHDGRFFVRTSDGGEDHYDRGLAVPAPGSQEELRLEKSRGLDRIGTPLEMAIAEHAARLVLLPEYNEAAESEGPG